MFIKKIYTAIEIDHNSHFKILEAAKQKTGYILNNFVNTKIPDLNLQDISAISFNLKKLMDENKICKKNVFANIYDNAVSSYNFYLPEMPLNDLTKAVEYEIKKLIPFPISSCTFDYIYIKTESNLNITAFVSKTEDINNFREIFTRANIKLKSIECKTVSIYNNIVYLTKNKVGHLLLCNISETCVKIVIVKENMVSFERTIEEINPQNINNDGYSNFIGEELKKTIDYYFAGKYIMAIDGIIMTGIYSYDNDFINKIAETTNIKTFAISIINQLKEKQVHFSLSNKLAKYGSGGNYDFFKPLEEMWTTFGLIVNR